MKILPFDKSDSMFWHGRLQAGDHLPRGKWKSKQWWTLSLKFYLFQILSCLFFPHVSSDGVMTSSGHTDRVIFLHRLSISLSSFFVFYHFFSFLPFVYLSVVRAQRVIEFVLHLDFPYFVLSFGAEPGKKGKRKCNKAKRETRAFFSYLFFSSFCYLFSFNLSALKIDVFFHQNLCHWPPVSWCDNHTLKRSWVLGCLVHYI